jgi:hypothetical protein
LFLPVFLAIDFANKRITISFVTGNNLALEDGATLPLLLAGEMKI